MHCLEKAFARALDECQRFPVLSEILDRLPPAPQIGLQVIWGQGGTCLRDSLPGPNYACGCRDCRPQDWCAVAGCGLHLTHQAGKFMGQARLGTDPGDYCEGHQIFEYREADARLPQPPERLPGHWERRAEALAGEGRAGFRKLLAEIAAEPGPLQGVDVGRVMRMKPWKRT
jgi:hypothetical protein